MKKRVILGLVIFIFCIVIFKHHHSAPAFSEKAVIVNAEKVKVGNIPMAAKAVGTLSAARNVQITPEFTGKVATVFFHDGAFVKQGTPLIQLDDTVYKAKAESAKAALLYSEMNDKRMVLLGKHGVVTKQAIDSAQADLKEKQAEAQEAQVALDKMLLTAPFDGVLGKSQVSMGDYVTVGEALVSITDIQHLRVDYSISEKYLPQLQLGQEVSVTSSDYPGKEFTAKVSYISPTINAEDRTISLYADLPNDARLLTAGLFVNVTHYLGTKNQTLLVSSDSLTPTIDGQQVYKIVNGKAVSVPVSVGERTKDNVEIISGVSANDVIVTAGQEKLKDGMAVAVKTEQKTLA